MPSFPSLQPFVVVPSLSAFSNVPTIPVIVGSPLAYTAMPFLWHVDILLLCAFGLFVVFTLPRAFARYSRPSELFSNFYLRLRTGASQSQKDTLSAQTKLATVATNDSSADSTIETSDNFDETRSIAAASSDDSHTVFDHASATEAGVKVLPATAGRPPRRVPSWASLAGPMVSYALNYPIARGLPVKALIVLLGYFGVLMYAATRGTSPFTDPRRPADIAVAQLPFVLAFAQKNNILGVLSGMGYEKLNFLHRFVGRIIVVAINMHTAYYLFRYSMDGTLYFQSRTPFVAWGILGTAAADVLFIVSTTYVRERAYGFFLVSHVSCFIIIIVAMLIHEPITLPYFLTAVGLYAGDHILRILRTRVTTAYVTAHPSLNGGSVIISVPDLASGWRAGQHVRIRAVPRSGRGIFALAAAWIAARWRARPFTVSTAPGSERGLELIIKARGRATRALYAEANGADAQREKTPSDMEAARQSTLGVPVTLLVEGPYSGPGHAQLGAFSGALLIAGGAGISYALAHLDALTRTRTRLRVLEVVWAARDTGAVIPIIPALKECLRPRASSGGGALAVRVTVYCTRAAEGSAGMEELAAVLPPGVGVRTGRPRVARILMDTCDAVRDACVGSSKSNGVIVATCGPGEIAEEAHRAVRDVGWRRWRDVRGVEVVSESFSM